MTYIDKELKTTKLWADTLHKAKIVSAILNITMVQLVHNLIIEKYNEVMNRG